MDIDLHCIRGGACLITIVGRQINKKSIFRKFHKKVKHKVL